MCIESVIPTSLQVFDYLLWAYSKCVGVRTVDWACSAVAVSLAQLTGLCPVPVAGRTDSFLLRKDSNHYMVRVLMLEHEGRYYMAISVNARAYLIISRDPQRAVLEASRLASRLIQ